MEKRTRPKVVGGGTTKIRTGCGNLYVTVNSNVGEPLEVFARLGKAGNCARCQLEALSRSISLGLKYGVPLLEYADELEDLQCPEPLWDKGTLVLSCPDAIARVLRESEPGREEVPIEDKSKEATP